MSSKKPTVSALQAKTVDSNSDAEKTNKKSRGWLWFLIFMCLAAFIAFLGYNYYLARERLIAVLKNNNQEMAVEEVNLILDQMRQITLLPNEVPVIATITDAERLLKESAFYHGAENGDRLVMFPEARRAYIYSPRRRIMVNAGPLVLEDNGQASVASASDSAETSVEIAQPLSIEIRNGSPLVGEASRLQAELESKGYTISAIGNAARKDYFQTQVIDLTNGEKSPEIANLVSELGATLETVLPPDETAVSADVLVIIGNP